MVSGRRLFCIAFVAALSACVTRPVAGMGVGVDGPQRIEVSRGDRLRILTRDGRRRTIRVQDADTTALYGAHETIAIADLVFVEREEFSSGNAAMAGGAVILIVLLAPVIEAVGALAVWTAVEPG